MSKHFLDNDELYGGLDETFCNGDYLCCKNCYFEADMEEWEENLRMNEDSPIVYSCPVCGEKNII